VLAVELGDSIRHEQGSGLTLVLSAICLAVSMFFVYRSFYGMRIERGGAE
jgi:K(+)-stimulated pyrophosphate-energized sodium pump